MPGRKTFSRIAPGRFMIEYLSIKGNRFCSVSFSVEVELGKSGVDQLLHVIKNAIGVAVQYLPVAVFLSYGED